jgi:hypothetical protein
MNFDLTPDLKLLNDSVNKLLEQYRGPLPVGHAAFVLDGSAIADDIARNGYLEVVKEYGAEHGVLAGLLVIESACRLPQSVEIAASALLAPVCGVADLPRPFAIGATSTRPGAKPTLEGTPIRFLNASGTVLVDTGAEVRALPASAGTVQPIAKSQFAYPFAKFTSVDVAKGRVLDIKVDEFRRLRRVALTGEILGAMQGALDLTVGYVKDRRQFGHPLGSLQAIQHRLSECATFVHGSRIMAYRAAVTGSAQDAELALTFAQETAARISYDSQQFHGALGQTLEYPLHYWAFRLRALQGEMGGMWEQANRAADHLWGEAA